MKFSKMNFLFIFSAIFVLGQCCEPIREPLCQTGIGYNLTIFPNLAGHLFQGGAAVGLQNIRALIDRQCSPNIREFLCRVYMPECYKNQPVLPSWEMCQEAYEGCATLMSSIGYSWSFSLNCSKFEVSTVDAIKKKAADKSEFWFGTGVTSLCRESHPTLACTKNFRSGHIDSIVSRFNGNLDVSTVDRLLQINYKFDAGSFISCNNNYTLNGGSFQVDPLSPQVHHPWEVRNLPTITWNGQSSHYFTLVIYDVGMGSTHAVYMNIPGHDISSSDAVLAYKTPMNPTEVENPYVFLLFEQNQRISSDASFQQKLEKDPVATIHSNSNLYKGLKAISWVRIQHDPYSISTLGSLSVVNNCPSLISEAIHHHKESFIPANIKLDVSIDVTYTPSSISFHSCCKTYVYREKSFELNPIGNMTVKTAFVRSSAIPAITLTKRDWYPKATMFSSSDLYTLLMVDPDASSLRIHWMVLNIPNGNVNEGIQVREYNGPQPPSGVHTYFFLLYKQHGNINPITVSNYTSSCSRCNFKINDFVTNNRLELAGASWMLAENDEYVRHLHVDERSTDIAQECAHQQGYPSLCSNLGGPSVTVG